MTYTKEQIESSVVFLSGMARAGRAGEFTICEGGRMLLQQAKAMAEHARDVHVIECAKFAGV